MAPIKWLFYKVRGMIQYTSTNGLHGKCKMFGWRAKKILFKKVAFRKLSKNHIPLISFSSPFSKLLNSHVFKRKTFYISTVYIEVQKAAWGAWSPTFSDALICLYMSFPNSPKDSFTKSTLFTIYFRASINFLIHVWRRVYYPSSFLADLLNLLRQTNQL